MGTKAINVEKLKELLKEGEIGQLVYGAMQIYVQCKLSDIPEGTLVFLKEVGVLNS